MNFDGGKVKIEVIEICFASLQASFIGPVGPIFFKGDDFRLFSNQNSAYLENSFEFTFNTPRPA